MIFTLISILFLASSSIFANVPQTFEQNSLKYRTSFNECPARSSGELAILIMKEFEKNRSLKSVKEKFISEKWSDKYFLSKYNVSFNPVSKTVRINLECPQPLVRVQVYKENGIEHYSAVMVSTGKLFDPSYEMILRAEKLLNSDLPSLAIPVKELEGQVHVNFTRFASRLDAVMRSKISEIIINENKGLSIIFSLGQRTTSVFLGNDLWETKLDKLIKIISYVERSHKYPQTINLTNSKKVVVKF